MRESCDEEGLKKKKKKKRGSTENEERRDSGLRVQNINFELPGKDDWLYPVI